MRSKIHKIHIILFCIFVSLVWTKYPVFAQMSGPQPSSNGTTTTQQDTQDRDSLRTSDIPQRSKPDLQPTAIPQRAIPDLQPTAPSPIEIEFQVRTPVIPGIAQGRLTQFGYAFLHQT